ncbi:MAG: ATP-binding protein, partial [Ignavibacteriales bacterium]|nr:ATP-binding protein [Ignavibacteriales bacterium]
QLHQLLLNLCVNARDAMGEKGTLSISIETISGSSLLHKSAKVTSDVYVALSVRDTGSGMNDETLKRMFDPFFTTKEVGKGTGLGLAVVMGIVDSHGATIDVESTVGRGTAFHVYFPAIEAVASDAAEKKENLDAVRGGEGLILFVEDEESVREFVVEVLQGKGFQIVVAVDGEEAIRIFEKRSNEIALVLSDMGLPKLNGEEVFRRVRTIRPEVPFILATGYIDPKNRSRLMDIGIKDILMKPYRLADLVNHINAAVPAE